MGYGKNMPDENTLKRLDEAQKSLLSEISPKYVYKLFKIAANDGEKVTLDCGFELCGKDISRHLDGCAEAMLMAATLSEGADRVIRHFQAVDMASAVIADALASAAIEQVCDNACEEIADRLKGSFFTWRFSPGYGDFPIQTQKKFLTLLNAEKIIGLYATESFLLVPTKSVTAIIGVSENPVEKARKGCAGCNMVKDCKFRERGERCV